MNPLGVHFIPAHTGRHHYDYMRAVSPGLVKVVGTEFPDVQMLSDSYAAAPDAIHYWRNHALSEQHADLWRDPINTAKRHAAQLTRDAEARYAQARERKLPMPDRDQVRLLGINEPVVEQFPRAEDMSNYQAWLDMMHRRTPLLDAYMETFGLECNARGYGAGLGNFSSGQPANKRPGDYPTFAWFPKTRALLERTRGRNALAVHEYWRAQTGPEGWWDWHTCRFFHYEGAFDIDVLECGVDQWITGANQPGNRGWQGHITPAQYADQMGTYIRRAMIDKRFRCAMPFTLDGDKMWWSFYIEPAAAELVTLGAALRAEGAGRPAEKPTPVYMPVLSKPELGMPPKEEVRMGIIEPRAAAAVLDVESGGAGFGPDNRLKIRFESHVFESKLQNDALYARHFQHATEQPWAKQQYYRRNESEPWQPVHTGNQASEWMAFELARALHAEAAYASISMGAAQIMGFNAARVGYPTAAAMFEAFGRSLAHQMVGFVNYVLSDDDLVDAMLGHDWRTIALLYNGPGQVDIYAGLLEQAYARMGGT